jgi:integrase
MPLTDTKIRALKPRAKPYMVADGNGLYLRVFPTGARSFVVRSRAGGESWTRIGVYPDMSLLTARKTCLEFKEKSRGEHTQHNARLHRTLRQAYNEWVAHLENLGKKTSLPQYRLETNLLSKLSSHALTSISRADISAVLTSTAQRAPVLANRLLTDCKQLFGYCVERGWLDESPASIITRRTVGGKETARARVLSDEEVVALIQELRSSRFEPPTRYALAMLLLTGCRNGEVRSIQRGWVQSLQLTLPVTKNGKPHKIAVTAPLGLLLRCAFNELGSAPFAGMEGQVLSRAVRRMGVDWTPHDLRRTMATRMADLGVAPHVIEKCLNHSLGGVMAVYNRAEYLPEKRAAWRLWARYVLRLAREAKKSPGLSRG